MTAVLTLFTIPIILLNTVGSVVAIVWLIGLGHFKEAAIGVLGSVITGLFIWIPLLPSTLLQIPAMYLISRQWYFLGALSAIPGNIWTVSVMTFYAHQALLLTVYESPADEPLLPYALFGYSVATSPWLYAASKDGGEGSGAILAFFLCVACALVIGTIEFVTNPYIATLTWTLFGTMAVGFVWTTLIGFVAVVGSGRKNL